MSFLNLKAKAEKAASHIGLSRTKSLHMKNPFTNPRRLDAAIIAPRTPLSDSEDDFPSARTTRRTTLFSTPSRRVSPHASSREDRFWEADHHFREQEKSEVYSDFQALNPENVRVERLKPAQEREFKRVKAEQARRERDAVRARARAQREFLEEQMRFVEACEEEEEGV
ncbi:hypothetical protein GLAREA_03198 [Glarea lozoyensis ATCC 20868]|nr:uncharacterized protein GLAREA_03198 [Glarea lozoyensis ATCC 20868]EPE27283.1 hypothetical protein GLAREA_03198 [Glarea lozoyensis ATCC 20868]